MRLVLDPLPLVLWALAVGAHAYTILKHGLQKELPMSEDLAQDPNVPVNTAGADPLSGTIGQPLPGQPAAPAALVAPAPPVATIAAHPVVQAVVNGVYTNPAVAPADAASVVASTLNQVLPVVLQASRASARTSIYAGLGVGVLEMLIGLFFPHPALQQQ